MKNVKITYNPYILDTRIWIEDKEPKPNSKLNYGKLRLQEWSSRIPQNLFDECKDLDYHIEFTGTETDFEDLKETLEKSDLINCTFDFIPKPSVQETQEQIVEIFKDILKGPVDQLKDRKIIDSFKKAQNEEFSINVVATMSAGKSTLINALLGKKLMPSSGEATTAKIVRVIHSDIDHYHAIALDQNGEPIKEDKNIIYSTMKEWNLDPEISTIDIYGPIQCVKTVDTKLILIDTPGPNNAHDKRHAYTTRKMLENSDNSLVVFVLNSGQSGVNDEKDLMDYVSDVMKKGGKQSRERYLFVVNKMDELNPDDDKVKDILNNIKLRLENKDTYGIKEPHLFPLSAQAALEKRDSNIKSKLRLSNLKELVNIDSQWKLESHYEFNNLPQSIKLEIDDLLNIINEDENREIAENDRVEIHTGIFSIEKAIGLYVDKYARPLKVKDLVDSFNNRLKELQAFSTLEKQISESEDFRNEIIEKIESQEDKVSKGQKAQNLTDTIETFDLVDHVKEEMSDYLNDAASEIRKIFREYEDNEKVKRVEAENKIAEIEKKANKILVNIDTKINSVLGKGYKFLFQNILSQYKNNIEDLNMTFNSSDFMLNPLDFVAEDLSNLSKLLEDNTFTKDEGKNEITGYKVNEKRKWYKPWTLFTEPRKVPVREYKEKLVDYVNITKLAEEYLTPIQVQIREAVESANQHAEKETKRIKKMLHIKLEEINSILTEKYAEIKKLAKVKEKSEDELNVLNSNLEFMKVIKQRVDNLINF